MNHSLIKYFCFFILSLLLFTSCNWKHKIEILPNDEIYTCPSHVHVIDDHLAKCHEDDTTHLVKMKITEEQRQMLKKWKLRQS